jgi:hypothetical protein
MTATYYEIVGKDMTVSKEEAVVVDLIPKQQQQQRQPATTSTATASFCFCSKDECDERQELQQVSALEATMETCHLPQAQRVLDPSLAVSKFRRSAAGTVHEPKPKAQLEALLQHLTRIAATMQASRDHPPLQDLLVAAEFLVDRLRACQADATRLLGTNDPVSPSWHAQLSRILIWMRYWIVPTDEPDSWMLRTIQTMLSTAFEQYWGTREGEASEKKKEDEANFFGMDDEMLCWSALSRIAKAEPLQTILLDYTKHARRESSNPHSSYPMFHKALTIASHVLRQEYYVVWKMKMYIDLPILAKCCLAPSLSMWRYQMVQQYNVSFAKQEVVGDLDRLLGISTTNWSPEYAQDFGLPVEQCDDDDLVLVIFKQAALPDDPTKELQLLLKQRHPRDDAWVFGSRYDPDQPLGMSGELLCKMLEHVHLE